MTYIWKRHKYSHSFLSRCREL